MAFPLGAKNVKSAVLHVTLLAHYIIVTTRGWAANSINAQVRLAAVNDRLKQETELLREEIRIKDARLVRIDPCRRPYCRPTDIKLTMKNYTDPRLIDAGSAVQKLPDLDPPSETEAAKATGTEDARGVVPGVVPTSDSKGPRMTFDGTLGPSGH